MLTSDVKRRIDAARDVLVGVAPNPTTQIEQITFALIYKFMHDMDQSAVKAGGEASFFTGTLKRYSWDKVLDSRLGNHKKLALYAEALEKFTEAKQLPELFRSIFRSAYLPYKSPETLGLFLKEMNHFDYTHPEELGNAYEYLLSIMSSQGDAGQFRTPRHIIDFMVDVINPSKDDRILDPACGTGGFLISSYKHILEQHDGKNDPKKKEKPLTPDERKKLMANLEGYDIDPTMVRIAQVNMYLHQFKNPQIFQYDTLTSEERWNNKYNVILANPPFMSPRGGIKPHNKFGISSTRAEVLFVDYIINHLKPKGRAGIIVPEGVIFQSGNAYKAIRKNLIENGLYAVVSLPGGVFQPYSGVKTSILLLDNDFAERENEIGFVKISFDGFDPGASKKPISANDLPMAISILDAWRRGSKIDDSIISFVGKKEIAEGGEYNLSGNRYSTNPEFTQSTWPMVQIGSIAKLLTGGTPTSNNSEYYGGEIKWLVSGDIHKGQIYDCDGRITELALKESNAKILPVNSVMIALNGQGKTRGTVALLRTAATCNQSLVAISPDESLVKPEYLYYAMKSMYKEIRNINGEDQRGGLNMPLIRQIEVPLPPLEVQSEIVNELDSFSSIIHGARQIIDNWNPRIEIDPEWENSELGDVISLEYGKPLKQEDRIEGPFPVYGSNGQVGYHNEFLVEGPMIVVGRKGSAGAVTWADSNGYPIDTTFYVNLLEPSKSNLKYVYFILKGLNLDKVNIQAGVPGLNRNDAYKLPFPMPSIEIQNEIVDKFAVEEAMVKSASGLISTYEGKTQAVIAKLWNK